MQLLIAIEIVDSHDDDDDVPIFDATDDVGEMVVVVMNGISLIAVIGEMDDDI